VALPGIYNEKNLLKHGVNWHFMNGAIVRYEGADPGGIFDTSVYGANTSIVSSVTGHGVFEMTSPVSSSLLYVDKSNCRLSIQGRRLTSFAWCILTGSDVENVGLNIDLTEGIVGQVAGPLYVRSDGASCVVRAAAMYSAAEYCIWVEAGTVQVEAARIESVGDTAACLCGGVVTLRVSEIRSTCNPVFVARLAGGEVQIVGARIIAGAGYPAVWVEAGASLALKLLHCVLIVTQTDYSMDGYLNGSAKQELQCQGQCMANEPENSATIGVVGLLAVEAGIS
jgi:hypothetical protein